MVCPLPITCQEFLVIHQDQELILVILTILTILLYCVEFDCLSSSHRTHTPNAVGDKGPGKKLENPEVERCGNVKTDSTRMAVPREISGVALMSLHRKESPVSQGD